MTRPTRPAGLAAALVAVLLAGACQGSTAVEPTPTIPAGLAAADARMWSGDYDGAEVDYARLEQQGVAGAASHHALLLASEGRFEEALAAAQAGALAVRDSSSLARLTRILDWTGDLIGALATGGEAVAARPRDPYALLFEAEALADSGRYDEAARMLRSAEAMGGDAAYAAETAREWANLYRDRGQSAQELNGLQLALRAQPAYPERRLELARHLYLASDPTRAQALVDAVARSAAGRPAVLTAAADSAFTGGDYARAAAIYEQALATSAGAEAASLGLAEIDVASRRDARAAHDVLLAALRAHPGSSAVYQYLRHLDLLVLHTDPDAELKPIVATPPGGLATQRRAAFDRLGTIRASAAAAPVSEDAALDAGALAHAYYYLFNHGSSALSGLGVHAESADLPGFSGADAPARAAHFGYPGPRVAEVIDHAYTPTGSLQIWLDSVYHRYPLLDAETVSAGYGLVEVAGASLAVLDVGMRAAATAPATVYPRPAQRDVPLTFIGNELPDPLPSGGSYPTGYPVTLQAGGASQLAVQTGRLIGPDGNEVPSYLLSPGRQVGPGQWALLPQRPLLASTTYTVELAATLDGAALARRWTFTTAAR